jgi:hypothetical protein
MHNGLMDRHKRWITKGLARNVPEETKSGGGIVAKDGANELSNAGHRFSWDQDILQPRTH